MQLNLEDCRLDLGIGENISYLEGSDVGDTYVLHEAFGDQFLHRLPGLLI